MTWSGPLGMFSDAAEAEAGVQVLHRLLPLLGKAPESVVLETIPQATCVDKLRSARSVVAARGAFALLRRRVLINAAEWSAAEEISVLKAAGSSGAAAVSAAAAGVFGLWPRFLAHSGNAKMRSHLLFPDRMRRRRCGGSRHRCRPGGASACCPAAADGRAPRRCPGASAGRDAGSAAGTAAGVAVRDVRGTFVDQTPFLR